MDSKKKVLEALQMQPLSEEEKASRHILGRLWGPIATTKEKTRNGRGYNAELWRKALADDIFREKVANKSLFLELGHPVDREETDMQLVCACIPEMPKIIDGDLYAYVDILDTKNGRLLKTLCDYGFIPGISSRGSGDIMANDDVDPETFFLETWDIVQLPAVYKARLTMCESLNTNKKLSRALKESLDSMSADERAEAEATLERLNVSVADTKEYPWVDGEEPLLEETEEITPSLEAGEDTEPEETEGSEEKEEAPIVEDDETETEEVDDSEDSDEDEETDGITVKDFVTTLNDFDQKAAIEFDPIETDAGTVVITDITLDDEGEDGIVKVSFNYNLETSDNKEDVEEPDEAAETDGDSAKDSAEDSEEDDDSEEASDAGDDDIIESLKEIVRKNEALEKEVLSLKSQKAVGDAEVSKLTEELDKYKSSFARVSTIAAKATRLQKEVTSLTESVDVKSKELATVKRQLTKQTTLTESMNRSAAKVKELQERLGTVLKESESTEQTLREQVDLTRKKARENAEIAKAYKQKYIKILEHYIASKANMLGVNTKDITSQLSEEYSIEDVDAVCDRLLESGRPVYRLGLEGKGPAKVKLTEAKTKKASYEYGYEIDDDLLELAGLK